MLRPHSLAEDALHKIDAVAAALVERARPVEFRLTSEPADVRTAQSVRAQALLGRGLVGPEDLIDGLEVADGDGRAFHIMAEVSGRPIGTGRLIFPERGRLLPMEERGGGTTLPKPCVELGRLAFLDGAATRDGHLMAGLIGFAWLEVRRRGEERICGTVSYRMLRLLRRLGFIVEVVGDEVELLGQPHVPIMFEATADAAGLAETGSASVVRGPRS